MLIFCNTTFHFVSACTPRSRLYHPVFFSFFRRGSHSTPAPLWSPLDAPVPLSAPLCLTHFMDAFIRFRVAHAFRLPSFSWNLSYLLSHWCLLSSCFPPLTPTNTSLYHKILSRVSCMYYIFKGFFFSFLYKISSNELRSLTLFLSVSPVPSSPKKNTM